MPVPIDFRAITFRRELFQLGFEPRRPTRLDPDRIEWRERREPQPFTCSADMDQTAQGMTLDDPGTVWWTYRTSVGGEVRITARHEGRGFDITAVRTGEPATEPALLEPSLPIQTFDLVEGISDEPVFEGGRWIWYLEEGARDALKDPPPGLAVVGRVAATIEDIEISVIVCEVPDGPFLYVCAIDRPDDAEIQAIACHGFTELARELADDIEGWLECGADFGLEFVTLMQLP